MGLRSTVPFSERRHCPGRGQRPAAPWGGGDRRLAPPPEGTAPSGHPEPHGPHHPAQTPTRQSALTPFYHPQLEKFSVRRPR